jgi:hypothetical protein
MGEAGMGYETHHTPCWLCKHGRLSRVHGYGCALGITNENGHCTEYVRKVHWTDKIVDWLKRRGL